MMDIGTARMLAQYHGWADTTLFEAMRKLPAGEIDRQRNTLFGSMLGTLNHIFQVQLIWQAHLLGREHGFSSRRDVLHDNFDDLTRAQDDLNRWFVSWLDGETPETLATEQPFRFVSGKEASMQRGAMLLHVVNHATYHRGWVCEMFFDSGAKPPQIDLSVYLCEQ